MKTIATVLLGLLLPLLTGCLGAYIEHNHRLRLDNPQFNGEGVLQTHTEALPLTPENLRQVCGEPAEIRKSSEGGERWLYLSNNRRWNGALIMLLVIPLPLVIPVGYEHAIFTVEGDRVRSVEIVRQDEGHALIGNVPIMCDVKFASYTTSYIHDDDDRTLGVRLNWLVKRKPQNLKNP